MPRGSRNAPLHTPEHDRCFPDMLWSPITISDRGQPSDPGTSLRVPPGCTGDMTRRLVAQSTSAGCGPSSGPAPATPRRSAAAVAVRPARRGANPRRPSRKVRPRVRSPQPRRPRPRSTPAWVWCPTCPFSSGVLDHRVPTGSPDPRQHPFGFGQQPVSGRLCGDHWRRSQHHPSPVSRRLSATGIRFSGRPAPAAEFSLPHSRPTRRTFSRLDLDGVVTFRMRQIRPGWMPSVPRGRWCAPARLDPSGRHPPPHSGRPLSPAETSHRRKC